MGALLLMGVGWILGFGGVGYATAGAARARTATAAPATGEPLGRALGRAAARV